MAANKLTDWRVRAAHVLVYAATFAVAGAFYADTLWQWALAVMFVGAAHFATDSKRWRTSNPWPAMPILQDQSLHAVQLAIAAVILVA
jgi:hypothetical protein